MIETEEEGDPSSLQPYAGCLIRQFGKQGSGRADFTLPSGGTPHPRDSCSWWIVGMHASR